MNFWILIILGIVQGLTEFLPVSSSGHLVLLYQIFGIQNDVVILSILLHLATLVAVLVYYRKDILVLLKHPLCPTNRKILVTTLASCVVVIAIKPIIDDGFRGGHLPLFFIITGILLWISDWVNRKNPKPISTAFFENDTSLTKDLPITYPQAIIVGLSQGIACIPGISRSGTTIATTKMLGAGNISAKYSFLISIPTILGSLLVQILRGERLVICNPLALIISCIVCFAVGLLCIKAMTEFVRKNSLKIFSIYLFILAMFMLINSAFLHLF